MINSLFRHRHLRSYSKRRTCIQIPIILRKSAGTDLQTDAMPGFEHLRGIPTINGVVVDFARLDRRWVSHAVAETSSYYAIAETLGETVGPDIYEFGCEVGIGGGR